MSGQSDNLTGQSGVLIGNSDIQSPEWVPTVVTPGTTPLPVYPKQADMEGKP